MMLYVRKLVQRGHVSRVRDELTGVLLAPKCATLGCCREEDHRPDCGTPKAVRCPLESPVQVDANIFCKMIAHCTQRPLDIFIRFSNGEDKHTWTVCCCGGRSWMEKLVTKT